MTSNTDQSKLEDNHSSKGSKARDILKDFEVWTHTYVDGKQTHTQVQPQKALQALHASLVELIEGLDKKWLADDEPFVSESKLRAALNNYFNGGQV